MPEKGGKLTVETVTEEIIDSSKSILQNYRGRGTRGLQQFFSPPQAAKLVFKVFGRVATLDLTAGNGALLAAFPENLRFGVEIDPDQTKNASYNALTGDIQKVYPLMRKIGFQIDAIALNPPFGLTWSDESFGGNINSTVLCYLYATKLISSYGQGVLIAGRDRLIREILPRKEGDYIYAIVEVDNMFENADIPTAMAFFTQTPLNGGQLLKLQSKREELPKLADEIIAMRNNVQRWTATETSEYYLEQIREMWRVIKSEYKRRYETEKTKEPEYSLDVDKKIKLKLSPYQKVLLANHGYLNTLENLNNQSANYFALNPKTWEMLAQFESEELITISQKAKETVAKIIYDTQKRICPLYPVKPQQRLGFLSDLDNILCLTDDPKRGFSAGEKYPLAVRTAITREEYTETKLNKEGELIEQNKAKERKYLRIEIGEAVFGETKEDIEYLINHFELPDPQDIVTKYPEEYEKFIRLLNSIEHDFGFQLKNFQREDIARLLFKGSGLLSWEQGLGKTLGGLVFTEACIRLGAEDKALFIVPQDIIPQWQREVFKFFGDRKELTVIRSILDARRVAEHLKDGGTGWYITYYEAISRNGREFELLPYGQVRHLHPKAGQEYYDWQLEKTLKHPTFQYLESAEFCPNCTEPAQRGKWHPKRGICEECGYVHIKLKVKPAYSHLTRAFKNGVILIDEGTKIKGHDTLMSKSVRGLSARNKLLLTGTPIKNYIPDAFWLLWWALGNNSPRFPFDYHIGPYKFAEEFAVVEYTLDKFGRKEGGSKILPEVSNLSILWRLLCSSIIRRRKEETGEPLVERTFRPVLCPFGEQQREMYAKWLDGFSRYFISAHPDAPISQYPDLVERSAAILGQLWKLEFSSVLPQAEPSGYYSHSPNWTPANLKVLELAYQHVQKGDKVLIGSDLMAYGKWVAEQLNLKDSVKAIHIVEESKITGQLQTKSPKKRANIVYDFRNDSTNVLCASLNAMNLGHNLDMANVVILKGLPWDFATFDQFIARVHRLTSQKPVTVYIVLTEGSVDERKWQLLNDKSAAAQLALDGRLFEQDYEQIDLQKILDELKEQGVMVDSVVPEELVKKQWLSYSGETQPVLEREMTEKEKELLERWLQLTPPKKKLRKLKLPESQLTLFEL